MYVRELETVLTYAVLRQRGIPPAEATEAQFADAAAIACEALETGRDIRVIAATSGAAMIGDRAGMSARVLARFAADGKHVADLTITEAEFLDAAIAEAQRLDTLDVAAEAELTECAHGYPGGKVDGCPYCA